MHHASEPRRGMDAALRRMAPGLGQQAYNGGPLYMAQYIEPSEARKPHRTSEVMSYEQEARMKRTHCVTAATFGMSLLVITIALLVGAPNHPETFAAARRDASLFQVQLFHVGGAGPAYGASARGLSIETSPAAGEAFPAFRDFWPLTPEAEQDHLVIYALPGRHSVVDACRFEVTPGTPSEMLLGAQLFARVDVEKPGTAPLTRMYHDGENTVCDVDDFRPEVHDSDGLLMAVSSGE